jgi:hypothetical protein
VKSLLDVNVLVALLDPDHVHHSKAIDWLKANGHEGWSSCVITINGCARVMSHASYPNPLPIPQVLGRLKQASASSSHQALSCALSLLDESRFSADKVLSANQITDIYLLGLAVHHGHRLVTLDARINTSAVKGALPSHLMVL